MTSSGFRLAFLPNPPLPLPRVSGPKLAPLTPTARADIDFVQFLGRGNDVESQVWKAKINGAGFFVLKMFYFRYSDYYVRNYTRDLALPLADLQLYIDYFKPFNYECRVYGRLKEEKREELAVKALGYLLLTPHQEAHLAWKVTGESSDLPSADIGELDGDNFWGRYEQHCSLPVRAIVKELVSPKLPTSDEVQGMWADLQALHSLGIFVGDTYGGNYLGGKLVDFSRVWTMYHPALIQTYGNRWEEWILEELQKLQDNCYNVINSLPSENIDSFEDLDAFGVGHIADYISKILPSAYNWLKWEKDADAAHAFVEQSLFKRA
ncbi:kinetochore Sim4 complex subunit FTA2-domain-containing protein [Dichotomopilus funicola]|uniref:Kinetochore Sim4 complex subunit FTA2-domain-containing protein n=1 Tax=Dichotomopilus funicola TaxID=1934379 RepID=A0AAN6V9Z3_9PEZI|nr:kinetochore Sim4 complex subunit FTA2-domain-containing protein [Dichotomopilus funicola]